MTAREEGKDTAVYASLLPRRHDKRAASPPDTPCKKWLMLAILSVLSAINQAICFSYAPIDSIVEARWQRRVRAEHLITIYFVSYIPCSFLGSWIMDKLGLRFGILLGGLLQTAGATLRYFACSFDATEEGYLTLVGQTLASFAMPFMVNSPAVLSANWFPPSGRATATSVAVNANALGTALVYLVAPFVVLSMDQVPGYNLGMAVLAGGAWAVALVFFKSSPESSSPQKTHLDDDYDWDQWRAAFTRKGFWHTLVAFSVAECVLNAMCALLTKFLRVTAFSVAQIGVFGAVFILSSLVGSQVVSRYVDRKRNHKAAMQTCLLLIAAGVALFRLVPKVEIHATLLSLLFLGFVLGPVQPIVLELGVECAYPTSAATVAALQQLCGNFLSAIVVPSLSALLQTHLNAAGVETTKNVYSSPEWILAAMTAATFLIFCFFDGEHKRYAHESKIIPPHIDDA